MVAPRKKAYQAFAARTTARSFRAIFHADISSGTARGRDGITPAKLELGLNETAKKLSANARAGTHRYTSYRQKLMSKGAGKAPRVASIASARDRILLKALAGFLADVYPEAVSRTAQEKVQGVQERLLLGSYTGFVRADVKDFYPSVSHAVVRGALSKRVRKPQAMKVVMEALTTPTVADGRPRPIDPNEKGVPQGLSISNILAELALKAVDDYFAAKTNVYYTRYVDDVLVLCDAQDAGALFDEVKDQFRSIGLTVHELDVDRAKSALGLTNERFSYLGYEFEKGRVGVREESLRRVDSAICRVLTSYRYRSAKAGDNPHRQNQLLEECRWRLDLAITGCVYHNASKGFVAYFSQLTDLHLLKRLDALVNRRVARFGMDKALSPKTYTRTYWSVRHAYSARPGYIPNFDTYTVEQQRATLVTVFGIDDARRFTEAQVRRSFSSRITRLVREMDQHIGAVS